MDNREVVIKVLSRSNLNDEVSRARFIQEAALLTKMEHPAIVPLYDKGFDGNQPYLVMRYMRGGTLSGKMSHGRLSPKFTCEVVEQISKALDFAHKHGFVNAQLFEAVGNTHPCVEIP